MDVIEYIPIGEVIWIPNIAGVTLCVGLLAAWATALFANK